MMTSENIEETSYTESVEVNSEEIVFDESVQNVEPETQEVVSQEIVEETITPEPEPEPEPEIARYLVLDSNNSVVNIIVYDGVSNYYPGDGLSLEKNPVDENGNYIFTTIGSVKNEDGTFTHPEPITE